MEVMVDVQIDTYILCKSMKLRIQATNEKLTFKNKKIKIR